jgi:hypothetical protein
MPKPVLSVADCAAGGSPPQFGCGYSDEPRTATHCCKRDIAICCRWRTPGAESGSVTDCTCNSCSKRPWVSRSCLVHLVLAAHLLLAQLGQPMFRTPCHRKTMTIRRALVLVLAQVLAVPTVSEREGGPRLQTIKSPRPSVRAEQANSCTQSLILRALRLCFRLTSMQVMHDSYSTCA